MSPNKMLLSSVFRLLQVILRIHQWSKMIHSHPGVCDVASKVRKFTLNKGSRWFCSSISFSIRCFFLRCFVKTVEHSVSALSCGLRTWVIRKWNEYLITIAWQDSPLGILLRVGFKIVGLWVRSFSPARAYAYRVTGMKFPRWLPR